MKIAEMVALGPKMFTQFTLSTTDSADSVSSSVGVVLFTKDAMSPLMLAHVLRDDLGYSETAKMRGYAEMDKDNPWRFNPSTQPAKELNAYTYFTESVYRHNRVTSVVIIDYDKTTGAYTVLAHEKNWNKANELAEEICKSIRAEEEKQYKIEKVERVTEVFNSLSSEAKISVLSKLKEL